MLHTERSQSGVTYTVCLHIQKHVTGPHGLLVASESNVSNSHPRRLLTCFLAMPLTCRAVQWGLVLEEGQRVGESASV